MVKKRIDERLCEDCREVEEEFREKISKSAK